MALPTPTQQHKYAVVGVADDLPANDRGIRANPTLAVVRATAKANPGRWVEFVSDRKTESVSSLTSKQFKFACRGGRLFCMYLGTNGTNGSH